MAPGKSPAFQFYARDRAHITIDAQEFLFRTRTLSLKETGQVVTDAFHALAAGDRAFFEGHAFFSQPAFFINPTMYISPPVRRRVYDRDGRRCKHCASTERLSIDHIVPRARGGGDEIGNLQTLCMPCNRRKGVS